MFYFVLFTNLILLSSRKRSEKKRKRKRRSGKLYLIKEGKIKKGKSVIVVEIKISMNV